MSIGIVQDFSFEGAVLKVIGIGGGGGNAVNNMVRRGINNVEFIAANTDRQALDKNEAPVRIQLGKETTKGLGAGGKPEIGEKAVEESSAEVKEALKNANMVFITAGMGGGSGTGGAPLVAKMAKEMGALVVAIVTKPFGWEGGKRLNNAKTYIEKLKENVDALIVIPNQRLLEIIDNKTTFQEAFLKVDEVLYNATRGISDIIGETGLVNVDFADVMSIMKDMGDALMGIGVASGDKRAIQATQNALNSPLLDGISINGAKGVLINISCGPNLGMNEVAEAVSIIEKAAGADANIIHGVVINEDLKDEIKITVVATGFAKVEKEVRAETAVPTTLFGEESQKIKVSSVPAIQRTKLPVVQQTPAPTVQMPVPVMRASATTYPPNVNRTQTYERAPKGEEQLRDYTTPALERRYSSILSSMEGNGFGRLDHLKKFHNEF